MAHTTTCTTMKMFELEWRGGGGWVDFRGRGLVVHDLLMRRSSGALYGLDLEDRLIGGLFFCQRGNSQKKRGRPSWSSNVRSLHKPPNILHKAQVPQTASTCTRFITVVWEFWLRVAFRLYLILDLAFFNQRRGSR